MLACSSPAHQPSRGSGKELLLPADPGLEEEGEENQGEKYVQLQELRLREPPSEGRARGCLPQPGEQGGLSENIRHFTFSNWHGFQNPARIPPGGSGARRSCVSKHSTWHTVPCATAHVLPESNTTEKQQRFSLSQRLRWPLGGDDFRPLAAVSDPLIRGILSHLL